MKWYTVYTFKMGNYQPLVCLQASNSDAVMNKCAKLLKLDAAQSDNLTARLINYSRYEHENMSFSRVGFGKY